MLLEPTADAAALAAAAATAGPIAIRFPAFGDGRGHSLAVLLRERHGFKGEIRAVGYLIPDLAPFLLRSGFDTVELADTGEIETWKAALTRDSPRLPAWLPQSPTAASRSLQARRRGA